MDIESWLKQTQADLKKAGITTARLDCLVLLEDETGKDRGWLLAHSEFELQGSVLKKLSTKIAQRAQHVPLAYIRGKAEFYGREFAVNAHTLVPRPETETMLDMLKALLSRHPKLDLGSMRSEKTNAKQQASIPDQARNDSEVVIVDIGTGSGAIAITTKLELPEAHVIATDIDQNCLRTAKVNAETLGATIEFLHGDLLQPLDKLKTINDKLILLCNLPYVPDNFQINTAATHEPRHALFGGPDGLDLYRKLFNQTISLESKPFYILTESLPLQHESLTAIAKAAGYSLQQTDDFIQLFTDTGAKII